MAVGESATRDDDRHAVVIAQLSLGALAEPVVVEEWSAIFERSIRERCASLAWHRSASVIRTRAPADVATAWRQHAMGAVEVAHDLATELAAANAVLGGASTTPIVLKGLPLSVRLYGEPWVRPSSDMDLYVPIDSRRACHRALLAAGWRHLAGLPPGESTYERDGARVVHLELHSSLFDDNILSHISAPHPDASPIDVGGTALFALSGPLEPIFLATHLAKHARVALLWWLDFASLWKATPAARRAVTRSLASQLRLERYLAWAESGAALVEAMAQGGAPACQAYRRLRAMHGAHNVRRVLALAAGLRDKWHVLAAWAWPVAYRGRPVLFLNNIISRVRDRIWRATKGDVTGTAGTAPRSLSVDSPEFVSLVRSVISEGGALWVRIHGTSMTPSIPRDAAVLLAPLETRGMLVGSVVLAELPDGRSVLHRVVATAGTSVVLQGDNLPAADPPLPFERILAVARAVETKQGRTALSRRPTWTLRSMVSRLRRRVQNA